MESAISIPLNSAIPRREQSVALHPIRLHGPWYLSSLDPVNTSFCQDATTERPLQSMNRYRFDEPLESIGEVIKSYRHWLLVRPFREPTGLTETSRIAMSILAHDHVEQIWLNGHRLPTTAAYDSIVPLEFPLSPQNRLGVVLRCSPNFSKPAFRSVQLLIHDTAVPPTG